MFTAIDLTHICSMKEQRVRYLLGDCHGHASFFNFPTSFFIPPTPWLSQVQEDIMAQLGLGPLCRKLIGSFDRPNISYSVVLVDGVTMPPAGSSGEGSAGMTLGTTLVEKPTVHELVVQLITEAISCSPPPPAATMAASAGQRIPSAAVSGVDVPSSREAGCREPKIGAPLGFRLREIVKGATSKGAHPDGYPKDGGTTGAPARGAAIVYVHKRDTAQELASRLSRGGFRAAAYRWAGGQGSALRIA